MSSAEPTQQKGFGAWLWRRPRRWFLLGIPLGGVVALLVGIGLTGGFVGGLKYAESTAFCTSCHEMSYAYQEYTHSIHSSNEFGIRASCGDCHVPPAFLPGLIRHVQASTEIWGHLTGKLDTLGNEACHHPHIGHRVGLAHALDCIRAVHLP